MKGTTEQLQSSVSMDERLHAQTDIDRDLCFILYRLRIKKGSYGTFITVFMQR